VDRRRALTERFIGSLLRDVFGFASLEAITPIVIDGRRYPVPMAALNGRVPVVVTAAGEGVESASATFGDGGRRRSPFGLAQEYLNAAEGATWGPGESGTGNPHRSADSTSLRRVGGAVQNDSPHGPRSRADGLVSYTAVCAEQPRPRSLELRSTMDRGAQQR
jgi:hypothetical protein